MLEGLPEAGWGSHPSVQTLPGEENHGGLTAAEEESAVCLEECVKAISAYFMVYYFWEFSLARTLVGSVA